MSFLDTVSAGFGAAFFLFIIFASLPVEKSSGMLGSEEYIQIELEWNSTNYNLELIVDPPGDRAPPQRLYLHSRSSIIESPITGEIADLPGRESWQKAFISGASTYGQSTSTRVESEADASGDKQRLSFRANGACPGEWKFLVAVKSNKNYLAKPNFVPFTISGRAFTSKIDSEDGQFETSVELEEDRYLPLEYGVGRGRGALLTWYQGPDDNLTSKVITIDENKNEPMEHCK